MRSSAFAIGRFCLTGFACLVLAGCSASTEPEPPAEAPSVPPVSVKPAAPESSAPESPAVEQPRPATGGSRGFVLSLLAKLSVRVESPDGYDRDLFADWADRGSCDVREIVLARQDRENGPCGTGTGTWVSPYDGERESDPSELDVDHFVPLAEAWRSGAFSWSPTERAAFANDLRPYALIAVTASSNRSKSDGDPAEWMPDNERFECQYVARWVTVKYRWGLAVDIAERRFVLVELRRCPDAALQVQREAKALLAPARPAPQARPPASSPDDEKLDPIFSTCAEALANGFGDYVRGKDSEYRYYDDGDGDGVVCE